MLLGSESLRDLMEIARSARSRASVSICTDDTAQPKSDAGSRWGLKAVALLGVRPAASSNGELGSEPLSRPEVA